MKNILPIVLIMLFSFYSCERNNNTKNLNPDSSNNQQIEVAFETAKQILYSLPTPVETAMILENTNVKYSDGFVLQINAVDLYETSYEKAVNLGVYSADLSYLSMFEQQQTAVKYLTNCKKLAEDLGLLNVISDSTINELHENIKNKDEVLAIITEQFMNINAYLEENDRSVIASLIVFGGWVEGLYLSCMLVGDKIENNPDLVQMIYDQKLSLEDLIGLMTLYNSDKQIKNYLNDLKEIKAIYDEIVMPMTQDNFDRITDKVILLRNNFTKTNN